MQTLKFSGIILTVLIQLSISSCVDSESIYSINRLPKYIKINCINTYPSLISMDLSDGNLILFSSPNKDIGVQGSIKTHAYASVYSIDAYTGISNKIYTADYNDGLYIPNYLIFNYSINTFFVCNKEFANPETSGGSSVLEYKLVGSNFNLIHSWEMPSNNICNSLTSLSDGRVLISMSKESSVKTDTAIYYIDPYNPTAAVNVWATYNQLGPKENKVLLGDVIVDSNVEKYTVQSIVVDRDIVYAAIKDSKDSTIKHDIYMAESVYSDKGIVFLRSNKMPISLPAYTNNDYYVRKIVFADDYNLYALISHEDKYFDLLDIQRNKVSWNIDYKLRSPESSTSYISLDFNIYKKYLYILAYRTDEESYHDYLIPRINLSIE